MKSLILCALLALLGLNLTAASTGRNCREIVFMKPHPIDCCTYPALIVDKELREKCSKECIEKHDSNEYCTRVCELVENEVYVDGKIKLDNFKNLFMNGKSESGDGEVKQVKGQLDETWSKIFDESLKTCEKDKEVKDGDEIAEMKVANTVLEIINCVRRHNFVACPDFVASKECADLKEAISTCSKSSESFLFGVFFENRKKDQAEGGAMAGLGKSKSGR